MDKRRQGGEKVEKGEGAEGKEREGEMDTENPSQAADDVPATEQAHETLMQNLFESLETVP